MFISRIRTLGTRRRDVCEIAGRIYGSLQKFNRR